MNATSCFVSALVRFLPSIARIGLPLLVASVAVAQSSAPGTVTGRIFNPATQQYVRNAEIRVAGTDLVAYSGDDGTYTLANVPAEATLTVTYTGYDTATARVSVGANGATQNFELQGSTYQGAKKDDIIKLGSFVVSSEREGNA